MNRQTNGSSGAMDDLICVASCESVHWDIDITGRCCLRKIMTEILDAYIFVP